MSTKSTGVQRGCTGSRRIFAAPPFLPPSPAPPPPDTAITQDGEKHVAVAVSPRIRLIRSEAHILEHYLM